MISSAIEVSRASSDRVIRGPLWDGGICEFACQGDVVVSPPLGFLGVDISVPQGNVFSCRNS